MNYCIAKILIRRNIHQKYLLLLSDAGTRGTFFGFHVTINIISNFALQEHAIITFPL